MPFPYTLGCQVFNRLNRAIYLLTSFILSTAENLIIKDSITDERKIDMLNYSYGLHLHAHSKVKLRNLLWSQFSQLSS
jgi:hypothetical protein